MGGTPRFSSAYNSNHLKLSIFISRGRCNYEPKACQNYVLVKGLNATRSVASSQGKNVVERTW